MDRVRIGMTLRRLRVRAALHQADVARLAGLSQSSVSAIECGLDDISLTTMERVFATVGASVHIDIRWRGPSLDRLMDERHAAIVEASVRRLQAAGWDVRVEVSYSIFGERGSVDILAGHERSRAMLVKEVKADIVRMDDTVRKLDEKVRLVRRGIGREQFGWDPAIVGRILVLPDTDRARRQVRGHSATLAAAFPARGGPVRAWLREPSGPMSGILFVANTGAGGATATRTGIQRVRVAPKRRSRGAGRS